MHELEFFALSCLYKNCFVAAVAKLKVTIRVMVKSDTSFLEGLYNVDCIMPTKVVSSGVIAKPSIPLFAQRRSKTAGIFLFPVSTFTGLIRSISFPLASKWTICGPYSSETQKVPSFKATNPSLSSPYLSFSKTL